MIKSYGTEAVDFAREEDAFIDRPVSSHRRHSWGVMVFAAALGVAGVSCVVTMHNALVSQQEVLAKMQQQL
ncbi:hypothetical protein L914_08765 [Phytophthora nicotianae]|nr:hypothetical protein L914_08765 [Phytophthora nicotianae]